MNAIEILKQHEIKKTPGRLAIISAIQESKRPLSENEIKAMMKENYDRITFYRNIQILTSACIIHKILVYSTLVLYRFNFYKLNHRHQNEHSHFYFENFKSVVCLKEVRIPHFNLPQGFKSVDSDIIIRGRCKKCNH